MLPQGISGEDAALGIKIIEENYHSEPCRTCEGMGKLYLFGLIPVSCHECKGNGFTRVYCGPANPFDPDVLRWRRG